ncbi:hypothetical protein D3C85_1809660 [compost metagenome]
MKQKSDEIQSTESIIIEQKSTYIDEQLNPMQKIEAGGSPKKVDLQSLPVPIRYIGYFIVFGIPFLFLTLIIISFLK